ncbi:LysE family translocator [Demequina sp. SYSU T00039]|uniref:LysE family translocator n=1 Tax=Demequina lignilytica TaxID=3051663 RepID=A0AAW7M2B0_9MICO|nr:MULTISPECIES: LysE family translocator [unclassified Demequina]MDN4477830.1 LysE family translocator [Demequina sp. SYSU T00039-1]MDN4487739.1 LysE family translocator [Demequina sp. SYSU T00039]MDN4490878.1 LysE family translocator [Demequina sp. SYSU T00068]
MIAPHTLLAFSALAVVVIVIPGPSVLFVVGRALHLGRGPALVSVVGNAAGPLVHAALVAVGVGALVAASEAAFVVLKVIGGLYLIWLGIQAIRHRGEGLEAEDDGTAAPSVRRLLAESFTVGVTNPKTLVFVAAVLPQFADPDRGPVAAQILLLGAIFAALAVVSDGVYVLIASGARDWFARSPGRLARVRAAGGGMIAALGVVVLLSRRVA